MTTRDPVEGLTPSEDPLQRPLLPWTAPVNTQASGGGTVASHSHDGSGTNAVVTNGTTQTTPAVASGTESVAEGESAEATGTRNIAHGYNANATGTPSTSDNRGNMAYGANSNSSSIGTSASQAFGVWASATGSGSTAWGLLTSSTAENSGAYGTAASASAADSMALGPSSNADQARSVALGSSSDTTAADQIQIGPRHIELNDITAPATPASGDTRLFHDSGTGKLSVKKSGGSTVSLEEGGTWQLLTLTDDTGVSGLSADEDWSTSVATVTNPGRAVTVVAFLTGTADAFTDTDSMVALVRVTISFDGGSTWNDGIQEYTRIGNATGCARHAILKAQHLRTGTPTGDIKIKALIQQQGGSAGDIDFLNGSIIYQVATA